MSDEFEFLLITSTLIAICIDIICIVLSSIVIHHSNSTPFTINNNIYPIFSLSDYELEDYKELTLGTYILKANNCIDLYDCPTKEKINVKEWRNHTFYTKDVKVSYKTLLENSVSSTSRCKSGYKQCGILNTNGDKLCLKQSQECPINYLKVTSSEINYDIDDIDDIDDNDKSLFYSSFFYLGESYLHYSNKAVNSPIVADLRFSIDEICKGGYEEYCDNYNYGQTHYQLIDKIDAIDFFNNETIQVGWYYREYIGFNRNCFDINEKVYNKINIVKKLIITFLSCLCITVAANGVVFINDEQKITFWYYVSMLLIKGSLILAAVIISASAKGLDACNDLYDERVYSDIDDKKINQIYLITMTVLTMIGHLINIVVAFIGSH